MAAQLSVWRAGNADALFSNEGGIYILHCIPSENALIRRFEEHGVQQQDTSAPTYTWWILQKPKGKSERYEAENAPNKS